MHFIFLCLSLLGNILAPPAMAATFDTAPLQSYFQTIAPKSVWPVVGSTKKDIEETFGPRIQVSTKSYDWHRGVDIKAALGTPVVAATDGQLWKVTYYPDGGNAVILRHAFPSPITYGGKKLQWFYTIYMHLNSIDSAMQSASNAGLHPAVKAGQVVGTVGHSGSGAIADHLHFEMRVGSWCTLEFQLANPNSSCSGFGFDPAMHPLWLFPSQNTVPTLAAVKQPSISQDGLIKWTNSHEQPVFNRMELYPQGSATAVSVLDLNTRTGFDPSTEKALDTQDLTKPYISPLPFSTSTLMYATQIAIPSSYLRTFPTGSQHFTAVFKDIWGKSVSYSW